MVRRRVIADGPHGQLTDSHLDLSRAGLQHRRSRTGTAAFGNLGHGAHLGELHRRQLDLQRRQIGGETRFFQQATAIALPPRRRQTPCLVQSGPLPGCPGIAAPFEFQQILGNGPTFVLGPEPVLLGHPHILKKHLIEFMVAAQNMNWFHREAGGIHFQQQKSDASLGFAVGLGADQAEHAVGVMGRRGPNFGAIDDIIVTVRDRTALQGSQIRARARFRITLAPDILARQNSR